MRPQFASPVAPLTAGDVGARKGSPVAAAALREGSADLDGSVVEGVVLPRNIPGGAVLRVDIEQHGTQQWDSERRCWSHRWSERARRIRAEPFELQLDSGAVVRVLVCDDVEFEGDLAGIIRAGPTTRVRVAELQPGVRAYVFGVLRGGGAPGIHPYRHGEEESLERPKHGRMRIAIRPPTPDFSKRAAPGFRKAGWIASVFAGLALSLCTYILPPAEEALVATALVVMFVAVESRPRGVEPLWYQGAPLIEHGVGTLHSSYWSPEGSTSTARRT